MNITPGLFVSHSAKTEWGSGKVLEVTSDKVIIAFSDGSTRKISREYFSSLLPADPSTYVMSVSSGPSEKVSKVSKSPPKKHPDIPKVISEEHMFTYSKVIRNQFEDESSGLLQEWVNNYNFLFDKDDIRLATGYQGRKQHKHFVEWYSAIKMYEKTGCYSLNEKYECRSHRAKQELLHKLISDSRIINFMAESHPVHGQMQCPDLLMYKPDLSDWYFCEVKGPNDKLRLEQALYWQELIDITGKRIVQVNLIEQDKKQLHYLHPNLGKELGVN